MTSSSRARVCNPRGSGGRLRLDIVAAARELLVETGDEQAVTLRAVARRVGIAAPSIYPHFDTTDEIVQAVVGEVFAELGAHLERARAGAVGGGDRLVLNCRAYVAFGLQQPTLYAILFTRPRPAPPDRVSRPRSTDEVLSAIADDRAGDLIGAQVFDLLLRDVAAAATDGSAQVADVLGTATQLWVAMHGLVGLRTAAPQFPWPDGQRLITELVTGIARLRPVTRTQVDTARSAARPAPDVSRQASTPSPTTDPAPPTHG